jgi:hypothetical protein
MSASTISTVPELSAAVVQELLEKHRVTLMESLAKMLAAAPSTPNASQVASLNSKKAKKAKKEVDPNAPPKEKRAPNSWILFAMRVEKLVRAAEAAEGKTAKETRLHTIVIKQFAASLKEKKAYDEWTDDEVVEELATWTPPEVSKQAAAKAAKAAEAPAEAAPAAAAPAEGAEKPKRQWSEEAKAAAALKRAATKAAKAAAAGGADAAEPAAEPAASAEPAVKKAVVIKPKAAAPAPAAKPVDLSFFSWTHEGKSYYTNDRGDVVTEDFEWVGRFDGTKIDEKVSEPADLGEATMRG